MSTSAKATIRDKLVVVGAGLRQWSDPPTTRDIERWLSNPAYSPWTRATYYSHARSYFGWLAESGRIQVDPMLGMRRPRAPKGKPRPLSTDEQRLILEHADGDLYAWLCLGLYAGLRVHEIAKLRGEDVDAEALYVLGKGGQTALLPTHPVIWELAQSYPRSGYWFPSRRSASGHRTSTGITSVVSGYFQSLGISGSIHRCRHSYGTNLIRGGANIRVVQQLLRHSSLATTALYTAVDDGEMTAAIRRLNRPAA
jgi:integrase/recombinase XerD